MFDSTDAPTSPLGLLDAVPGTEWADVLIEQHATIARHQFLQIEAVTTLYLARCEEDARRGKNEAVQGEFANIEVAGMLHVTEGTALAMIDLGCTLRWRLHRVRALFAAGRIDLAQTTAIADALANVPDDKLDEIERLLVEGAERMTGPNLRTKARRLIARHDPDGARRRRELAEADRDIRMHATDDGMTRVDGLLPAAGAQILAMRLRRMTFDVCCHDPRTFAQRRADALVALGAGATTLACRCGHDDCTGRVDSTENAEPCSTEMAAEHGADAKKGPTPPSLPKATITVGVNAMTLLGLDDLPGYLAGHGPIDAELARDIATDGTWRKVLTLTESDRELLLDALAATDHDPDTASLMGMRTGTPSPGHILGISRALTAAGITPTAIRERTKSRREALTYRPSARLAEIIRTRDGTCRFPGCTARASNCDIDHTVPFDHHNPRHGGPTVEHNLACLCRTHHRLKTEGRWKVRQLGAGLLEWTDPHGTTTITTPDGAFSTAEANPTDTPFGPLTDEATLDRLFGPHRGRGAEDDLEYLLDAHVPNWRTTRDERQPRAVHYTGSTCRIPQPAPF
ncbi:DUF222 domain-containing protein [Rhodococcus sp. NPDC127528]|uniref:HNH endonuclease signature motif containing protein n=1 Tax=unclassified Rhodococcus (in: high G+C Gram-positive bacteria) TaxID=192944 RepID=UPI003632A861